LFNDLIKILSDSTRLCIATDISLKSEKIKTDKINNWRKGNKENLNKRPTIFIIDKGFI